MNWQMSLASALALSLLHSLWQLALLGLLANLSFMAMRQASASARHVVGMAWLVAMALAPVATFVLCWRPPSLQPMSDASSQYDAAGGPLPALPDIAPGASWLLVCLAQIWLVGVVVMVARQIGGWRLLQRVEREPFVALPAEWQRQVDAMCEALGITRRVSVRLAANVVSPFTARALRPLVWLPLALLTRLPVDQVRALLAHELAHISRLDWCWNALQCAIEALLFHHPAMWWLSRRIREEREHACDDLAVAVCGDAIALAEALAALPLAGDPDARSPRPGRRPHASPQALAAEGGSLMKRITHLLAPAPVRPNWRVPGALLLLLGCGSLLAMQVAPPAQLLTNLTTEASSPGDLTPGNHREFSAHYLGEKTRRYRIDMDLQGRITERYTEDDVDRPIDAGVRGVARGDDLDECADDGAAEATHPARAARGRAPHRCPKNRARAGRHPRRRPPRHRCDRHASALRPGKPERTHPRLGVARLPPLGHRRPRSAARPRFQPGLTARTAPSPSPTPARPSAAASGRPTPSRWQRCRVEWQRPSAPCPIFFFARLLRKVCINRPKPMLGIGMKP